MRKITLSVGLVAVGLLSLPGCPTWVTGCDEGPCGSADGSVAETGSSDASVDAKADADPPPPGCDTPNEPLKNPEKCLVDSFGVFVSPTGDDGNPGTKAKPFKTIGKALGTGRSRVAVCEGTYGESLELARAVEIYGSLACTFDKAGGATKIESGKEIGLTVSAGTVGMFGMEVIAKDATEPGESSIGVALSSGVTFKMVGGAVSAGVGASAPDGTTMSNYSPLAQSDPKIKGNDGSGNTGGATQTCAMLGCVELGAGVEGGAGGAGTGTGGAPGADGKTSVAGAPAARGKGGGYDIGLGQCTAGNRGADADGAPGGAGATTPGTLDGGKWTASRGANGQTARAGQGGGGGSGGQSAASGGGGSGGCGGCGGGKGQGGISGGSSFAVLSVSANVTLENVSLKAGAGGKGAKGGDGQGGQPGGAAGLPALAGVGCPGGLGGQGGQGGGGGGGAGGHSIAVAYTGTKPTLKTVKSEFSPAPAVGGEPGATAATATQATAGAPGKTGADLAL